MSGSANAGQGLRVFVDSNVLISALLSGASVASQFLTVVLNDHRLILCDHGVSQVEQVIRRKVPKPMAKWETFLAALDFEMVHTPTDLTIVAAPNIWHVKDRPILISALIAEPDAFVSGDQDFHTPEISQYLMVYTPRQFLDYFGLNWRVANKLLVTLLPQNFMGYIVNSVDKRGGIRRGPTGVNPVFLAAKRANLAKQFED